MARTHVVKEKGINTIMAAKKYREIKKEFPIEEGKLVADKNTILKTILGKIENCLLYTSPSPRDKRQSRMPSSA